MAATAETIQGVRGDVMMRHLYTQVHQEVESDTPQLSRATLIKKSFPFLSQLPQGSRVLDLGAGTGILEREFVSYAQEEGVASLPFTFFTADVADYQTGQLYDAKYHTQTTAAGDPNNNEGLAFCDDAFDAAVSNLALEHMDPHARKELARVVKPGGSVFLVMDTPTVVPADVDSQILNLSRKISNARKYKGQAHQRDIEHMQTLQHKRRLTNEGRLFAEKAELMEAFRNDGLIAATVERVGKPLEAQWWFVELRKEEAQEVVIFESKGKPLQ